MTAVGIVTILVAAVFVMGAIVHLTDQLFAVWSAGDVERPADRVEASEGAEHCDHVG